MTTADPPVRAASVDDAATVAALRAGDEAAFTSLVERLHPSMMRMARLHLRDAAAAEDVVQEAWLGVLRGIGGFEGRSSLRTWVLRIVANRAKTRAVRDGRTLPFAAFDDSSEDGNRAAVDPARFLGPGHPMEGGWTSLPTDWTGIPEERLVAAETLEVVRATVEALPAGQRAVIDLRDVQGWTAEEVCNALEISETNQRVLLHRARAKVRAALERHLDEGPQDG